MRAAALLALLVSLAVPAAAPAAEFAVDSTAPGLGNCAAPGSCTLRQAMADAKLAPGRDTVRVPPGTYDQTGEDLIVSIGQQLEIVGADPRTTHIREVSGGDGRVFLVEDDARLDLANVTVSGSRNASAILLFGTNVALSATNVQFVGNTAANGAAIDGTGGAVTVTDSTFVNNTATAKGGAIYLGGAASSLTTHNTTITANTAPTGAGVMVEAGSATLRATTVAGNTGADVHGPIALHGALVGTCTGPTPQSLGGNAAADPACGIGARTGALALAPLVLEATTATMTPGAGSVAIDADPSCAAGARDQRGAVRPVGSACDAGAVESPTVPAQPATPPVTTPAPGILTITDLRLSPTRWRPSSRGARITFQASGAGPVRFTVERARSGRRVGRRCLAPTRTRRRAPRCTRHVALPVTFTRPAAAGANAVRFAGRSLRPGRHRLIATPVSGHRAVRAAFTVVR